MTSKIQQSLDTFMDYNLEEQQKCLGIVDKLTVMVKEEFHENTKNQQAEASNSNEQETPTMIQGIPETWKGLWRNELSKEKCMENTELTIVKQESEAQPSRNNFIKVQEAETSSKNKEKRRNIQCYNCTKRGHIMKDCPFFPRIIKRKNNTYSTFIYF